MAVIGVGGAGKTTFSVELGRRLGLPVIHLDRLYWRPGWSAMPDDEWRSVVAGLVREPAWVLDGNYSRTLDLRVATADTLVFFDVRRPTAFLGVARRWLRHHGRAVQADGCTERLDREFLAWLWHWPSRSRLRVVAALEAAPPHLTIHRFRSRRAAWRFLDSLRP